MGTKHTHTHTSPIFVLTAVHGRWTELQRSEGGPWLYPGSSSALLPVRKKHTHTHQIRLMVLWALCIHILPSMWVNHFVTPSSSTQDGKLQCQSVFILHQAPPQTAAPVFTFSLHPFTECCFPSLQARSHVDFPICVLCLSALQAIVLAA